MGDICPRFHWKLHGNRISGSSRFDLLPTSPPFPLLEAWPVADSSLHSSSSSCCRQRQLAANCYGLIMCICVACLSANPFPLPCSLLEKYYAHNQRSQHAKKAVRIAIWIIQKLATRCPFAQAPPDRRCSLYLTLLSLSLWLYLCLSAPAAF